MYYILHFLFSLFQGVIDDVIKSIDRAIEGIHNAASQTGTYTKEQRKNLE